jgi:tetratricopeptide (TPR) repeat protein
MKSIHRLLTVATAVLVLAILPAGCNKAAKAEKHLAAARTYYEKADYAAAEIKFKNALTAQPGHPEALKGLGLTLLRQGALLDAAGLLSEAKLKLPADDELGVNLGKALLALAFVADSRRELLEVLGRQPAHGEALLLLAESSLTPEAMTECEERIATANAGDQAPVLLASALIAIRRGQLEAGTTLVERAVAADPNSPRAHALRGNLYQAAKQPEKALETLKKASDLAGPRSDELGFHAMLLAGLGRKDEAVTLLKEATQAAPDYLPNWRLLARIAFADGKDDEAAADLAKVLAKSPLDIEAGLLQSQLWLRKNEPAKAIEMLEALNMNFPLRPQLELPLGKAHMAAGDFRRAAEMLDRVLAKVPGAIEAIELRSVLHLKNGQAAEAVRLIEPLHAAQPANRQAQDLLAAAYRAANRTADAIAILKRQAEDAPEDVARQFQIGELLRTQGKAAEARPVFEQVLKLSPNHLGAVSHLAALDQQEGKTEQAMARVDAYLSAHPESPQGHLLKASLCFARKDHKAAEASAIKAIELKPDDSAAYSLLVHIQLVEGRSEEAVARLKQLLEASPANLSALMYLGSLQRELGRTDEARACFAEIVKIDPKFALAYNDLACIDSGIPGQLDQAWENARKARTLRPDNPAISDTYGWIEWLRGDYRQALSLLLESASGLPGEATVLYHLAMTHYMMHQLPEAIAAFDKALAIPGGFPEQDQAMAHLAILRDGGQMDLATLEQRLKESPKDIVIMVLKARKLAAIGRPEDAIRSYQSALAVNPDIEVAYLGLADLYASTLKQPDKAMEAATRAREVAPQSARAAAVLGAMSFSLGKHEDAFNLLQEAARKLPGDPGVQGDYAWAAYSMGRVADARSAMSKLTPNDPAQAADVKDFLVLTAPNAAAAPGTPALVETRLAANPADVPALLARAALQEKAGESPVAAYAKVLELFPQFDPARIALARVYLDDPKQWEAAESLANAARERLADDPDLSGILAIINFRKGRFDYAAQLLKELSASAKRPLTGRELFALGMSQAATKQPAEARQTLALALQAGLPESDASVAKATLERLDKPAAKK